jgi:hypothetical protein
MYVYVFIFISDDEFAKPITFPNYEVPVNFRNYLKRFYKQIFALENFGG